MQYYSDRTIGLPEKKHSIISPPVWSGIVALINSFISRNYFAFQFPLLCEDGQGPYGTDEDSLVATLIAENPNINWPLEIKKISDNGFSYEEWAPDTITILDIIEFCFNYIAAPLQKSYHSFFKHYHLGFDPSSGQKELIARINTIFDRNGIMYTLAEDGHINRNNNEPFDFELNNAIFRTGDPILDEMLNDSRQKYLKPQPQFRKESVERLWDSWERLKTVKDPTNKQHSVELLMQAVSSLEPFRNVINEDARALTDIGNRFMIRHTEIDKIQISEDKHWDYLFQRMFAIIQLILSYI